MKKARVGVVGVGRGAMMFQYCKVAENAEIVAICDKWEEGLRRAEKQLEGAQIAYYTDSDEVDNLAAEILAKVDKTVPEINQVTRLFSDVRDTSDMAVEKTTDIQGSIEACAQAMDDNTATTAILADLAQKLTDAAVQFKVEE